MSIFKVPYKLEVWEESYNSETRVWEEKRSVCLGTHDMDYAGAAYDVKFDENVNGEKNLSFSLVGDYIDITTGKKTHNYLVDFLYNEAKIKLQYDGKWYDFIVKNISENHTTQLSYQYTCKYLPIIELSKIGYDIQFSLDDATGSAIQTAPDFIEETLKDTDWRYIEAGSEPCVKELSIDLTEYRRETAYEGNLSRKTRFYRFKILDGKLQKTEEIFSQGTIIIPYSQLEIKGDIFVGLLDDKIEIYDNLIDRHQLYITSNPFIDNLIPSNYQIEVPRESPMSDYIRYIDAVETHNSINQYCTRGYLDDGQLVYRRAITQVVDKGYFRTPDKRPVIRHEIDSYTTNNLQKFEFTYDNLYYIFDLTTGRNEAGYSAGTEPTKASETIDFYIENGLGHIVRNSNWNISYEAAPGYLNPSNTLEIIAGVEKDYYVLRKNANGTIDYIKYTGLYSFDFSFDENEYGFYELDTKTFANLSIKDAYVYTTYQFFTVERDATNVVNKVNILGYNTNPDDTFFYSVLNGERDTNKAYYDFDKTNAVYIVDNNNGEYEKNNYTVEKSYEMYRTVEASHSNCFNITQQVAETFNVWCRYIIEYDNDGRIAIGEDGRKKKWVTLTNTYGTLNKVGFTYGLNTNSIQRTINSDEIITKLYVDYSEGSAAEKGFVAIQYAKNNISGENTIYNFDYYVQKGLLKVSNLNIDLYKLETKGYSPLKELADNYESSDPTVNPDEEIQFEYLGYMEGNPNGPGFLRHLGLLNKHYDDIYEVVLGAGETSLSTQRTFYKTQKEAYQVAINTKDGSLSGSRENDEDLLKEYSDKLVEVDKKIKYYESLLAKIVNRKQEITRVFNRAYSRFIQEGNWSSSSYINHDDYYADASKVSQDGSKPRVEYTLNVVNLYALPQYKEFKYNIGDITWIEDIEYFGYNNNGTPYHEKVIVSQISRTLDVPINDTFVIANYSNKFEDVFQTLAAQVQSYSLNEQLYQRAAHFSSNGTLSPNVMSNTFGGNKEITLMSNDNIVQTNEGLIFKNPADRNRLLRITAGGIVISNDGGESYSTGIYDGKINTSLLQSGQLNVEHIHVYSTGSPGAIIMTGDQFRMYSVDKDAYYENGEPMFGESFNIDSLFKQTVDIVKPDDGKLYYIKEGNNYISVNSSLGLDQTKTYYEYIGGSSRAAREIIMSPLEGFKIRSGNQDKVYFDTEGNLTLEGVIIAEGGEIGGFNIGQYSLESLKGETGLSCGINNKGQAVVGADSKEPGYCFWAGAEEGKGPESAKFWVKTDGQIYSAKNEIVFGDGTLVGGWKIDGNKLTSEEKGYFLAADGEKSGSVGISGEKKWALLFKNNFGVDSAGVLYASNPKLYNATITGTISGYCTTEQYNDLVARVTALENSQT